VAPSFPDESALILHVLSMTKGKAADWARPHIGKLLKNKQGAINSFKNFLDRFGQAFQDPDAKRVAARQINELKQAADVESYITDFENLAAELNWNEEALQAAFEKGLYWKVKEVLSQIYPAPADFHDIKEHVRRIDATLRENEASRPKRENKEKKNPAPTSSKTTTKTREPLTESPNYVSPEERDKRRKEGLCNKCGSPDHLFRDCKNGWKKDRVPGK
jgi:hypothetical protein